MWVKINHKSHKTVQKSTLGRLNIKIPSYIGIPIMKIRSYLYDRNHHSLEDDLYIEVGLWCIFLGIYLPYVMKLPICAASIIRMIADVLAPYRRQVISSHNAECVTIVSQVSCQATCTIMLWKWNNLYSREVVGSPTHWFHFYWQVLPVRTIIWGLWCQKQVSEAVINNYIPQFIVGCNYLSLPEIPTSGAKVPIYHSVFISSCP